MFLHHKRVSLSCKKIKQRQLVRVLHLIYDSATHLVSMVALFCPVAKINRCRLPHQHARTVSSDLKIQVNLWLILYMCMYESKIKILIISN